MIGFWSILPGALEAVRAAIRAGRPADMPPTEPTASWGMVETEGGERERPYRITEDGTAIVAMSGPLFSDGAPWWLVWLTDGTTYGHLIHCLTQAIEDPLVQRVVLDIDSPGGMVTGCAEAGQAIRSLAATKPITAYARGYCASAAYWLASQCSGVTAAPTAAVGCLGVRVDYYLYDRMYAEIGIDHITITSADTPRKAPDLSTEEGRADAQVMCDRIFDAFAQAVAEGRGVDDTWVRESMGQGAVLVGSDAVAARLVDRLVVGPEAACQESDGEVEAVVELPPDESSPTPGASGHTQEVPTMGVQRPVPPRPAAPGPDPTAELQRQLDTVTAERDALQAANAALTQRLAAHEQADAARAEADRVAKRDAMVERHAMRVGPSFPRAQISALADKIGTEEAEAIAATYPAAGGLPTQLRGVDPEVSTPKSRAELKTLIEQQAKAWGCDYNAAYARLAKDRPDLFKGGDA